MREAAALETLSIAALAVLVVVGAGCSTTRVDVTSDDRFAFAQLDTWNWLPSRKDVRQGVDAPHRDAARLHAQLGKMIARQLGSQGYEHSRRANAYVIYHLVLVPRKVAVQVPRAPYLLSSMNHTPSYWIEGTDEEIRIYEDFRLVIALLDRMVRRVVVRLGRPQQPARAAATPSSSAPLSGDRR